MHRKGWIASALFAALCLAGITTLLSQADLEGRFAPAPATTQRTMLDPPQTSDGDYGRLVPSSLREGAEVQARKQGTLPTGDRRTLRLR